MTTLLPADDVLLRGYCGPCDMLGLHLRRPDEWVTTAYGNGGMANGADHARLRLNCALPAVRDHVARVCAGGAKCPACKGSRLQPGLPAVAFDPIDPCEACDGSGHLLRPAPIWHLLDTHGSRLTAAQSAVLVSWSYRSWRRGGPVLRGVASTWDRGTIRDLITGPAIRVFAHVHNNGWSVLFLGDVIASGPETGPEGRARADAAALAHNFALLDGDTVVTPPEPA